MFGDHKSSKSFYVYKKPFEIPFFKDSLKFNRFLVNPIFHPLQKCY